MTPVGVFWSQWVNEQFVETWCKILPVFCCKLILKKNDEHLIAVQRPKVMEKKMPSVCKPMNYYILLQNHKLML